jgi:hypothetical protein
MFDNLSERLSRVVKQLRGEARLTDANIQDALREVRLALLEATATHKGIPEQGIPDQKMHLSLRFDAVRTSTAFGGCRDAIKGAKIRPEARYALFVSFAAEAFFRDAISPTATLRFSPFVDADQLGNNDQTITMDELDAMPLTDALAYSSFYQLPTGTARGS